jgi:hypothetical protein
MPREPAPQRYRHEGETVLVELHLHGPLQLFDLRDPAPFHDRDLSDDAVSYLLAAMEDLRRMKNVEFRFIFECKRSESNLSAEEIDKAIRAHFRYEYDRAQRQLAANRRQGLKRLFVAIPVLALALAIAARIEQFAQTHTAFKVVREGLTILGWVTLWNPIELLLFSGGPIRERAQLFRRIERAPYRFVFDGD